MPEYYQTDFTMNTHNNVALIHQTNIWVSLLAQTCDVSEKICSTTKTHWNGYIVCFANFFGWIHLYGIFTPWTTSVLGKD